MTLSARELIHKTRVDYDTIAAHFSETRSRVRPWQELVRFARLIPTGSRVLDWGCGDGRMLRAFGKKNIQYVGVDQSKGLLALARQLHAASIVSHRAEFFLTTARAARFPDQSFDAVCAIASFHHLPDVASRRKVLLDWQRALKPNGRLLLTVWNLGSDWVKEKNAHHGGLREFRPGDWFVPWKNRDGSVAVDRYYHAFTIAELRELLVASGFRIRRIGFLHQGRLANEGAGSNIGVVAVRV